MRKAQEKKIAGLINKYLESEKNPIGKNFQVEVSYKTSSPGKFTAFYNCLKIIKTRREPEIPETVYDTGMVKYRGAGCTDKELDLLIQLPAILKETKNEVIYAFRTGAGKVKLFRFNGRSKKPKCLAVRDVTNEEVIDLVPLFIPDVYSFLEYAKIGVNGKDHSSMCLLRESCRVFDKEGRNLLLGRADDIKKNGNVAFLLVHNSDGKNDSVVGTYYIIIWIKRKGFALSKRYHIGISYFTDINNIVGIGFNPRIMEIGDDFIRAEVEVGHNWHTCKETRRFLVNF